MTPSRGGERSGERQRQIFGVKLGATLTLRPITHPVGREGRRRGGNIHLVHGGVALEEHATKDPPMSINGMMMMAANRAIGRAAVQIRPCSHGPDSGQRNRPYGPWRVRDERFDGWRSAASGQTGVGRRGDRRHGSAPTVFSA